MSLKYGIDFGSTNSSIAVRYNADTQMIDVSNRQPKEVMSSRVCLCENGDIFVGDDVITKYQECQVNGIRAEIIDRVKMKLDGAENGLQDFCFYIGKKSFDGLDVIVKILEDLRIKAEKELEYEDFKPSGVVMGVPVFYSDKHKDILIEALWKAGFYKNYEVAKGETEFVSEPVAVAVHYGLQNNRDQNTLVFDFGGGTLDLAIVEQKGRGEHDIVKAKSRLTVGGEDLDKLFFKNYFCDPQGYGRHYIGAKFFSDRRFQSDDELWDCLKKDSRGYKFIEEIIKCKLYLSTDKKYKFNFIYQNVSFVEKIINRNDFKNAIYNKLQEIKKFVQGFIDENNYDKYDIDNVIVAGGTSIIPCVQDVLFDIFGYEKVKINPGEELSAQKEVLTSIARGLAVVGSYDGESDLLYEDVLDCDYGVWDDGKNRFSTILKKGTSYEEASKFDKIYDEGAHKEYQCVNSGDKSIRIQVYQKWDQKEDRLGTIPVNAIESDNFKIFMHIDKKKGKLIVDVKDEEGNQWYKIDDCNKFDV